MAQTKSRYKSDERMTLLVDLLKEVGIIRFDIDFCRTLGMRKQNLIKAKNGEIHFTPLHIEKAIKAFNVDANWIFGITDNIFLGHVNGHTEKAKGHILENEKT